MESATLLWCVTVRVIQVLLLQTYFNPDEYWQCLEVAHHLAFGYGYKTWEWAAGLRGYLHPLLFAVLYKGLYFARVDTTWVIARSPQLLQASFAAITDIFVYNLAHLQFGQRAARWTLLCQLTNWFNAYCLVRTYSNSFEALCTVIGVHCWCLSLQHQEAETTQTHHNGPHHPQKVLEPEERQPLQPSTGLTKGASKQSKCPFGVGCLSSGVSSKRLRPPVLSHRQAWLLAAAVGVLFRPSSMLFWLPL
ncbi:MAG: Alg9-like mannosyltransferase family, partial [Trebouxia sp. A1-2]